MTAVVVGHNADIIKTAVWVIDLGHEVGTGVGRGELDRAIIARGAGAIKLTAPSLRRPSLHRSRPTRTVTGLAALRLTGLEDLLVLSDRVRLGLLLRYLGIELEVALELGFRGERLV
jgi:hypothetical protein